MNELNLTELNINGATLLSPTDAPRQLYVRKGIIFLLYDAKQQGLIFAFASSELGQLLAKLNYPEVKDVSIVRFEALIGSSEWPEKAIYLDLQRGKRLILYSDDCASIEEVFRTINNETHYLKSPRRLWGGSHDQLDCMLLTPRLVQIIDDISEAGKQLQYAHILWEEYIAAQKSNPLGHKIEVTGEFMEFSACCFRGKLVVFDLIK